MATVTVNDASLTAIAEAIRGKLDVETTYLPSQMAAAIESIETGGTDLTSADEGKVVVESSGEYILAAQTSLSVSQNGTYDTTTNNEVVVNVSGGGGGSAIVFENQDKTLQVKAENIGGDLYATWYFNGYSKSSSDVAVPSDGMDAFDAAGPIGAAAYDSQNGSQNGWIGFYKGTIRSWSINQGSTIGGTFWATLYMKNGAIDSSKSMYSSTFQNEPYTPMT